MSLDELVIELNAFYNLGKERRECNALIQCFGIKNAEIIREIDFYSGLNLMLI